MIEPPGAGLRDPLGASCRRLWRLDRDYLTVNHGSYGATPLAVLAAQDEWRARMEAQPTRFMALTLPAAMREAAARLAAFVGAEPDNLVFVSNATEGCNAVLRSLGFGPGDEILCVDHVYNAVHKLLRHVGAATGARLCQARLPFPEGDEAAIAGAVIDAMSARTRLLVLDHITSPSALVLPVASIIEAARARGIPVLIDGAHAPGQVALAIERLGADWYVGNCHKWLMAPKGCGFLWAAPARQAGLRPLSISHFHDDGFIASFDWTGTRDPSAFLAVGEAIAFHEALGGPLLRARNDALAREAASVVADGLGGAVIDHPRLHAAMSVVALPGVDGDVLALRERFHALGTDLPVASLAGRLWVRLSAQAYNEPADYARLVPLIGAALLG